MNIPKLGKKPNVIQAYTNNKAVVDAFNNAKKVAQNTPSYQVPTYELRLQAKLANRNLIEKALHTVKTNKKAIGIGALIAASATAICLVGKKFIDSKNEKNS